MFIFPFIVAAQSFPFRQVRQLGRKTCVLSKCYIPLTIDMVLEASTRLKKHNNKPYEKLVAMKDNSSREFPLLQAELRNKAAILKFNVITTCTNFGPLIG